MTFVPNFLKKSMNCKGKFSSQKVGHSGAQLSLLQEICPRRVQFQGNARLGVDFLYIDVDELHSAKLLDRKFSLTVHRAQQKVELLFHDF
jgi:hypothetical protein